MASEYEWRVPVVQQSTVGMLLVRREGKMTGMGTGVLMRRGDKMFVMTSATNIIIEDTLVPDSIKLWLGKTANPAEGTSQCGFGLDLDLQKIVVPSYFLDKEIKEKDKLGYNIALFPIYDDQKTALKVWLENSKKVPKGSVATVEGYSKLF